RALAITPALGERACTTTPPCGWGRHAWYTRSAGQAGTAWTMPKITAVAPGGRVTVVLGAADLAGVAVAPGAEDAGTVVPGTRAPQDTVTRTTAAGSSRRR